MRICLMDDLYSFFICHFTYRQFIASHERNTMKKLNFIEKSCCSVLRAGAIPQHIGFIMDGNRRFAKKQLLKSSLKGHEEGVQSLKKTLLFCKELGVQMISLFCFSIENFNRSKEEVDGLMALVLSTFSTMSSMSEMLLRQEIKVNIVGKIELLREDVQEALQKVVNKTKDFTKMQINLCFAYDGIYEAESALEKLPQNATYQDFFHNLGINRHLDILVRTANEHRLSNFMLAQCSYALICILKETWPEMGLVSFCKIIFEYNYSYRNIMQAKNETLAQEAPRNYSD